MNNVTKALAASALLFGMAVPATASVSDATNDVQDKAEDKVALSEYEVNADTQSRVKSVSRREGAKRLINRLFIE